MRRKFSASVQPVISRLLKRVIQPKISENASEVIELSPATTRFSPSAICLEEEFSRAISSVPSSSLKEMSKMIPEGEHHHRPTLAFCLEKALVADGSTYCGTFYSNESSVKRRPLIVGYLNCYEVMQLSSSAGSEIFFGHWLLDGMCHEMIAQDRNMESLIHRRPPRFHEPGYREIFDLHPIEERVAHVDKLWVVDDRGVNDYKLLRFSQILDRVKQAVRPVADQPKYIFLARRGGVGRNLVNENDLAEVLQNYGFYFVDCSNMSPIEIIEKFSAAQIVVSVEGSHQSHAVLSMPRHGAIVSIQPPDHVNLMSYRAFCDFKSIRQAFIIGELQDGGFRVDTDRILKLIDLTIRSI